MSEELDRANREAEALLAELEAKDAANDVAATVYKMPPEYAPGERPRLPSDSVAKPGSEQLGDALNSSFRPVNMDTIGKSTLPSSVTVDFAQKIRDARKPRGTG